MQVPAWRCGTVEGLSRGAVRPGDALDPSVAHSVHARGIPMSYHVVKRHVTSVTNFELLHLLRQRGVRTPEEAAAAEEAAWAAQHRRQEPLREDVEVEDEGDAPPAAPAPGLPPPGGSGSQHPPPVYPRVNPPFAVEQAARPPAFPGALCFCPHCLTPSLPHRRRPGV